MLEVLDASPTLLIIVVSLLGLIVGSFLNVVIYRLPLMLEQAWQANSRADTVVNPQPKPGISLALPASHCPHCQTDIAWYDNIPLFSYCLLGGKCRHCQHRISARYPLVEALTSVCSALTAWRLGYSPALVAGLLLSWALIAQSFIDIEHYILADSISLPMTWAGLWLSLWNVFCDSQASIIGAISGYLSLWSIYHVFRLITGKEGMGYGDFKLLAMLGAWLGWQYLPLIIVLSSLIGSMVGILMILNKQSSLNSAIPFGPYLAGAGWLALLFGDTLNSAYLAALTF